MSFNRENITWQSKDGTWSLGFYRCVEGDTGDPDYDPEWDVDYDFNRFEWVSTGHRSAEAADASYDGANPGGGTWMEYAGSEKQAERLDAMAADLKAARR